MAISPNQQNLALTKVPTFNRPEAGAQTDNARPTPRQRWADIAKPVPPLPLDTPFIQGAIAGIDLQKKQASLANTMRQHGDLHKQYGLYGNNILVVLTSQNKRECDLLFNAARARKPNGATLIRIDHPGWSGVGNQAYEGAGAIGAHNKVLTALGNLLVMPQHVKFLKDNKIGSSVVGAVEDFIVRARGAGVDPATKELVTNCPVDWGFVVFCRVRLAADPAFRWSTAVTQGAPVPMNHCITAGRAGYEDEKKTFCKVTIGKVIGETGPENEKSWDEADWQAGLIGKSWYAMLGDALNKVRIPWP
ncbi:predicted protein [Chaetomium globosum CBS 148.51]|uniref:Uncharacterized protein n=1 Tax=Chaetomium globosum (strain ATCC 6205 / CBS 148.51 / DSM 1962 / NBRC 6347 / NRRL 1970) TaxID=306901 RepID=Q2HHH6_CHAGB|nr:uncharacterized protein CHGG_00328 [Chaetomium globosum CBS 148.51]EAQ92093.1 predicted protein [Chaetomium globosum CBS 148.51]